MIRRMKLALMAILFFPAFVTFAQSSSGITNCVYIQNAMVVAKPGAVPTKANILIRDGQIQAIGPVVAVPFDARVIKADSMFVYASFIDGLNHTGLKREEPRPTSGQGGPGGGGRTGVPSQATLEQSGVTPQVSVIKSFSMSESAVADMRNAGVAIAHIVPNGNMLPGKGSIASLGMAPTSENLFLKKDVSTFAKLSPSRGMAPGTVIGVMSKFRDLYKNTEILQKNMTAYEQGLPGVKRPNYVEELAALMPVVNKKEAVFFEAERTRDIHKVLMLKKELGFNLVLTNVKQVDGVIADIKSSGTPILLSLKLPEEVKKDTSKAASKKSEDELNFAMRKEEAYKSAISQAAMLEKNGIKFAFSFKDLKISDLKKTLNILIENGLSQNTAHAALTTTAAEIIGIGNRTGTVEVGKLANIIITDTTYFHKNSKIRYVLVDGNVFEQAAPEKPKDKPAGAGATENKTNIDGKYSYSVSVMGQNQTGWINFEKSGSTYKITTKSDTESDIDDKVVDVDIKDSKAKFTVKADMQGMAIDVKFDLTFSDSNTYEGTVSVGTFGSFPITGSKIPN
jgi:imidazolonepropionase-like amidohydrolase